MKRPLFTLIVCLVFAASALAQANVTFQWDTYPAPLPNGFEMTLTPASGSPIVHDCGPALNASCPVSAIPAGVYTAFIRAYNVGVPTTLKAYSPSSNVVSLTVPIKPAMAPAGAKVGNATMAFNITWPGKDSLSVRVGVAEPVINKPKP